MNKNEILDRLYEIQRILLDELPQDNTPERNLLNKIDSLIDDLEGVN